MADYNINCLLQKTDNVITATVAPFKQNVRRRGNVTVEWNANGDATFPAADFFRWKTGGPGHLPTRSSDGKTLSITYDNQNTVTWTYMITLSGGSATDVIIDPDIHNDPPPTM